ncbi:response regulator transcription factor [Paenibacillus hemerocallicola]|uniref:Response regulator transcription factor n=1 Tax=Paenibacillus hemerocallicola TaxID=1172614 RepID=A0A5C4T287_9BACL|nr:response regulator transcription factor [Paenibacillus hemerocallicola]TNJ62239.1 response regulator transcription factor [Paenibacillus hemerocallicola]
MIRIVIAEDQRLLLGALGALLDLEDDLEVVGGASNGVEAIELIQRLKPDVCILDIEMPGKTGLDVAEELQGKGCKFIILTTFARAGYFERAVKAGVSAYMLKDSPIEELAGSVRSVMTGKRIYATELIVDLYGEENPLTDREKEILQLLAAGKTTKEMAEELFLTTGTVRNYISGILDKLDVNNRIEAITLSKEKGWMN